MSEVRVTVDGEQYSVEVSDADVWQKTYIASEAPDSLLELSDEMGEADVPENVDMSVRPEITQYMVNVLAECTEMSKDEAASLDVDLLYSLGAEVIKDIFSEIDDGRSEKRVKRVRVTQEFIECLFRGELTMVCGMPDDATFEDFHYDPSRQELQFIFSSEEFEPIDEAAEIPVHEAMSVSRSSSTKSV